MALSFDRPWALLLWPALLVVLFVLARRRGLRGMLALALRVAIITLLVLGLAGPTRATSPAEHGRTVILVDRSASINERVLLDVQAAISQAGLTAPETMVVQFGQQPQLVSDPAGAWPSVAGLDQGTDLAAALDFAGQLLASQAGTLILASDGAATTGDTLAAAERLAQAGVRVNVLPLLPEDIRTDVAVEGVIMPGALWAGEPFSVTVNLYSLGHTDARLSVQRDSALLTEIDLRLQPGENHVSLSVQAEAEGLTAFEARVTAEGDERPQNDFGGAVGLVRPSPAVLIVAQRPDLAQRLRALLVAHNISAQVITPAELPASAVNLGAYQILMLMDVSAERLTYEQLAAIDAYVYSEGNGLVVVGGPSSFSLGGYQATPLERMLPISLEPPERAERPPANLLLIIDHSGSMTGDKMALAREAAMRAVEILQPQDRVGVLAFNHEYHWRVPLGTLGQGSALREVLDSISSLTASGGTDILTPLEVGIDAMRNLPPGTKHVVLLSDGESMRGTPPEFRRAVQAGLADEITVSAIALGARADTALMADIAEWGQGRFHYATAPESLPRMVLAESQSVRSDTVQRGAVGVQISAPHPMVSHFSADDFPELEAYVAVTDRPGGEADVVLRSPLQDPLLASWQYGLGRVVAWTTDLGQAWTPAWATWPRLGQFWTQVLRFALPDPAQGGVRAEASVTGDQVLLTVQAVGEDGRGINLADAHILLAAPDGARSQLDLPQTAPGEYAAAFTAPQPGAWRGLASLERGGQQWQAPVGFVVSYSPEFSPRLPSGVATLNQVAALTGGRVYSTADLPAFAAPRTTEEPRRSDDGLWLVLAALALWPLEIAIRRRWMPWTS
jgi:Ca-activated chloride channel homolog